MNTLRAESESHFGMRISRADRASRTVVRGPRCTRSTHGSRSECSSAHEATTCRRRPADGTHRRPRRPGDPAAVGEGRASESVNGQRWQNKQNGEMRPAVSGKRRADMHIPLSPALALLASKGQARRLYALNAEQESGTSAPATRTKAWSSANAHRYSRRHTHRMRRPRACTRQQ